MTQITHITHSTKLTRMQKVFSKILETTNHLFMQPYVTTSSINSVLQTMGSLGSIIPIENMHTDVKVINIPATAKRPQHIVITKNTSDPKGDISIFIKSAQQQLDTKNIFYIHIPSELRENASLYILRKKIHIAECFTIHSAQQWSEHMTEEWFDHFELIAEKIWKSLQNIYI